MKRQFIILLFLALISSAWAQKSKDGRVYLDNYLQPCKRAASVYYMEIVNDLDSVYFAQVKTKDGRLKMEGYYKDVELTTEHGKFTYFYVNGKVESTGDFVMGAKSGLWMRFHSDGRQKAEKLYDPQVLSTLVYTRADNMPTYPGGQVEMKRYIVENMHLSEDTKLSGKIRISLIVEPDGELSEIQIMEGINDRIDKEVIRVIGKMPRWHPGMDQGRLIRTRMTIPIKF